MKKSSIFWLTIGVTTFSWYLFKNFTINEFLLLCTIFLACSIAVYLFACFIDVLLGENSKWNVIAILNKIIDNLKF